MAKFPIGCCGYYCARCDIYIASTSSDLARKANLAVKLSKDRGKKLTADDVHCWGCWSNNRNCWGKRCFFRKCTGKKGLDFCYQCHEFPCAELKEYYQKRPDAYENLIQISKVGLDAFASDMANQLHEEE